MNGWRRPQRERQLSLTCPITGSSMASAISAIMIASPTVGAGRPITWL